MDTDAAFARLDEAMGGRIGSGDASSAAWSVRVDGVRHDGACAATDVREGPTPGSGTIFRISSMSKPITAVAAMTLVEEGLVGLADPVDRWLPELAGRRVVEDPTGPLSRTVPAERSITVDDLLTFRLGLGFDFTSSTAQPVVEAMAELDLGIGPPAPQVPPEPNEWMRRLATVPLQFPPGERWLYHVGAEVLGVLVARVAGRPLDLVLRERVLDPLGMADTGFFVPKGSIHRLGACHVAADAHPPGDGDRPGVYDPPEGQWASRPAFPSGGAGLVSTIDDYMAFASMLLDEGVHGGGHLLSAESVRQMTTNQLTTDQVASSGIDPDGLMGWGLGMGVQVHPGGSGSAGNYGWAGGLGSTWFNDPTHRSIGVLMTDTMWTSPAPPPIFEDFTRWVTAIGSETAR